MDERTIKHFSLQTTDWLISEKAKYEKLVIDHQDNKDYKETEKWPAKAYWMAPVFQAALTLIDQLLNEKQTGVTPEQEITITNNNQKMEKIEILLKCVVEGTTIKLPDVQLDHAAEYTPVKKALERIGGKWNPRKKGFVFDQDPTEYLSALQRGEEINLKKEYQFFATPTPLANYLVSIAHEEHLKSIENPKILEPSAGDGALVKALVKHYPNQRVDCFELMQENRIKLQQVAGSDILGNDFLHAVQIDVLNMIIEQYDLVIANPPFSKFQDIDHIRAMYKCLKPGGLIVTICSPSLNFGTTKKQVDFREWLSELGADQEEVPTGHFKESGTQVGAYILTIKKPLQGQSPIIKPKEEVEEIDTTEAVPAEQFREPEEIIEDILQSNREIKKHLQNLKQELNPSEEMEFFNKISELIGQQEVSLVLKPKGDKLTVMLIYKSTDNRITGLPAPMLTGTADELDESFFATVSGVMNKITGLVSNVAAIEAKLDGATPAEAAASEPEKPAPKRRSSKKTEAAATTGDDTAAVGSRDADTGEENGVGEVVETIKISAEEEEANRKAEEDRLAKEQEEEEARKKQEEADRLAKEREEKFTHLTWEATELEASKDYLAAAKKLKEAKEFTDDPDSLKEQINSLMTKALED